MAQILVIEDEANLSELYAQELSDEGFQVVTATNGKAGLEVLQNQAFDLVVLDLKMPQMDGIETLGKIVNQHPNLPVVINSAYSRYKDDFRAWSAEAYVVKSADLGELIATIKRILTERGIAP